MRLSTTSAVDAQPIKLSRSLRSPTLTRWPPSVGRSTVRAPSKNHRWNCSWCAGSLNDVWSANAARPQLFNPPGSLLVVEPPRSRNAYRRVAAQAYRPCERAVAQASEKNNVLRVNLIATSDNRSYVRFGAHFGRESGTRRHSPRRPVRVTSAHIANAYRRSPPVEIGSAGVFGCSPVEARLGRRPIGARAEPPAGGNAVPPAAGHAAAARARPRGAARLARLPLPNLLDHLSPPRRLGLVIRVEPIPLIFWMYGPITS